MGNESIITGASFIRVKVVPGECQYIIVSLGQTFLGTDNPREIFPVAVIGHRRI